MVWRLDRLGRSLPHLLETVERLEARDVGFRSVTESIDTTTAGDKLIFSIFGALAEFERNSFVNEHPLASRPPGRVVVSAGGRRR